MLPLLCGFRRLFRALFAPRVLLLSCAWLWPQAEQLARLERRCKARFPAHKQQSQHTRINHKRHGYTNTNTNTNTLGESTSCVAYNLRPASCAIKAQKEKLNWSKHSSYASRVVFGFRGRRQARAGQRARPKGEAASVRYRPTNVAQTQPIKPIKLAAATCNSPVRVGTSPMLAARRSDRVESSRIESDCVEVSVGSS